MSDDVHTYEAKVWQRNDTWKAKVLRDGMLWSTERDFDSREEALEWAGQEALEDRTAVAAEAEAERVAL